MAAQQKYSEENSSHQSKSTLSGESAGKIHGSSLLAREWGTVMATPEEGDIGEVMELTDTVARSSVCSDSSYFFHFEDGSDGKTPYFDTVTMEKLKNDSIGDESLSPSKMEPCTFSTKNQETHIAGFDLNEDIKPNAMDDDYIQQDVITLSSHGVIKVVAKAGIPNGAPMFPSKFKGQMGLTWSGETSAFRCIAPSKSMDRRTCSVVNSQKKRKLLSGIDLNVAAVEQSAGNGSPLQHFQVEDSRKTERLEIDLNSLCDVVDEQVQSSLSFKPPVTTSPVVDLNINLSSKDKSNGLDWLGRGRHVSRHEAQNTRNAEQRDFNFTNNRHWTDLRTMQQHIANHNAQCQQHLLAAPYVLQQLQQTPPFMANALDPQNYVYASPAHLGSRDTPPASIYYSGTMLPNVRHSPEHGVSPQLLYPLQVVHEQRTENITWENACFSPKTTHR